MKISQKDKKLLLYTSGILTLLLVFFWFFKPAQEANRALQAENEQLQAELAVRQEHDAKKKEYRNETKAMKLKIEETLLAFPEGMKEEDIILYGEELERTEHIEIADISIGTLNQIYMLGQEKCLNNTQAGYTFTASYDDWKGAIEAIQNHGKKRNVESVVLSFDAASGKIIGSMNLNFYSMTGTGREYQKPDVPDMPHGIDNIFGTVSAQSQEEEPEE